ncbi:MAG: site-specific integrase [Thermoanaerobaculia bacterium]
MYADDLRAIPGARTVLLPFEFASLSHLDQAVERAIEQSKQVEGLSPVTGHWVRGGYRSLRRFVRETGAENALLGGNLETQVAVLDGWVGWLRQRSTKRSTINSYWRGMVFAGARLQTGRGLVNIFRVRPAPHPGRARLRCLTREDATRVLAWVAENDWRSPFIRERNTALIAVFLLAGLRRSEARALLVNDVNLESATLAVRAGKGRFGGKPRDVPMTEQLHRLFTRYLEERRRSAAPEVAFFLSAARDRPIPDVAIKRLFGSIEQATGIHASPHVLRHTFCTLLSQAAVSDRLAMQAMGHADLRMLQRYQHVFPGELAREIQKLRLDLGP